MRVILVLALILSAILVSGFVDASGCVVRQREVYHAQNYYYPPVVSYYQAIPIYSFGYASSDVELQLKLLRSEMEMQQLKQELKALRSQQPAEPEKLKTPPQKQTAHPFEGTMQKSCLNCHSAEQAKAKGSGFVLADAKGFLTLTDRQIREMQRRIYSGNMPKGSKLTDQQVGEAMDWLDKHQSVEDLTKK